MATLILRPNADVKADQTEVPGGTAFSCLDDAVTQPTVPDTTDYVTSSTPGQFTRNDFTTAAIPGGETVSCVRLWLYIRTALPRPISARILSAGGTYADKTIAAATVGWVSVLAVAPFTQAQIDGIRADWAPLAGAGSPEIACWYIEVPTRADIWNAANAKFRANRDPETGLSLAAGYMRADFGPTADLGGGRSLCFGGDGDWATAAGQQPLLGNNIYTPGAPRANFINNVACILDNYNVDLANFTFFSGPGATSYFAGTTVGADSVVRWPLKPFVRSGRLFVVGMLTRLVPLKVLGFWAAYCDDYAANPGNPNLWTWTFLPSGPPDTSQLAFGECGIVDLGDGNIHMWSLEGLPGQRLSCYRITAANFQAGNWRRGEWWNGSTFVKDRPGTWFGPPTIKVGRRKKRGAMFATALDPVLENYNGGFVHKRASDGKFQFTAIFDTAGALPSSVGCALTPSNVLAKFGAPTDKYLIPEGENFVYSAMCHPHLTGTGFAAGDQVWSYACGATDDTGTWGWNYGTRWIRALAP